MKFDIMNQNTWGSPERMLGGVGNTIGKLYSIKNRIEKEYCNYNAEYKIANNLSSELKNIFNISIIYPNTDCFLADMQYIQKNWTENLAFRKEVVYDVAIYLRNMCSKYNFIGNNFEFNIDNITSPKVRGNRAWDAYLQAVLSKEYWYSKYTEKSKQFELLAKDLGYYSEESPDFPY